jgi:hypothetical protein
VKSAAPVSVRGQVITSDAPGDVRAVEHSEQPARRWVGGKRSRENENARQDVENQLTTGLVKLSA